MKRILLFLACLTFFGLHAEMFFTPNMIAKHLKGYTPEEIALIKKDLAVVRSVCMDGNHTSASRFYLATAGGPGARKTTILEKFLAAHPEYRTGIYLDPDPRTLRYMVHTYYAQSLNWLQIALGESYDKVLENAYEKWRAASNYIVLTLLEDAYALNFSVIYGTTSTGQHIPDYFARLKQKGYQIVLLLCSCPDAMRRESIEYRNSVVRFYQSSPDDAVSKGKLFPQKMGSYFAYGDLIYIYWSDDLSTPERLAAIWEKGRLEVVDDEAFDRFTAKYEEDRKALLFEGQVIPAFETYLQ